MSTETWVEIAFEGAKFLFDIIQRFVGGDRSEEVLRVIQVLPRTSRSRLELIAQEKAAAQILEDV